MFKVVELFAGIGGFRRACDNLGLKTIWVNEIEPKATAVYRHNFGDLELTEANIKDVYKDVPNHDLLTAGFPCQPFSSAGKKKGINDIRGTLFEDIAKIIEFRKPKYFILENVKRILSMQKGYHFAVILKCLLDLGYQLEWRLLNSAAFGLPQARERVIITGRIVSNSPEAVLCNQEDFKNFSQSDVHNLFNQGIASGFDILKIKDFKRWGLISENGFIQADLDPLLGVNPKKIVKDILEDKVDEKYYFTEETKERIKVSSSVNRFVNGVEILYNQRGGARMGYTVFGINGLAPTLTCQPSRHYERYFINSEFRRLTPIEYARIQGFSDNHCINIKPRHQYALFGNAVPPKLVEWGIERLIKGRVFNLEKSLKKQMDLI